MSAHWEKSWHFHSLTWSNKLVTLLQTRFPRHTRMCVFWPHTVPRTRSLHAKSTLISLVLHVPRTHSQLIKCLHTPTQGDERDGGGRRPPDGPNTRPITECFCASSASTLQETWLFMSSYRVHSQTGVCNGGGKVLTLNVIWFDLTLKFEWLTPGRTGKLVKASRLIWFYISLLSLHCAHALVRLATTTNWSGLEKHHVLA